MMKMKRIGAATVALLVATSLAACGGSGGSKIADGPKEKKVTVNGKEVAVRNADYLAASYGDLKDGGTLTLATVEVPDQGNIFHQDASAYSTQIWYWYNPQVILFDNDLKAYGNPDFLTSMKAENKDGKTIVTYNINEKAKFNNGEPITWKAFETTWKINNGKTKDYAPSATDGYELIESVVAGKNDREVVVTFSTTYPWWEGLFNALAYPDLVDPKTYKEAYLKKAQPDWGAGPYKIEKYDPNAGIVTYVPNEKWWGDKGKLDRITLRVMEDNASLNAFKNGEVDISGAGSKDAQATLAGLKDVTYFVAMSPSNSLYMLNSATPVLKDIKVREAIFSAIDREKLTEIRFNGVRIPDKDGNLTEPYTEAPSGSLVLYPSQEGFQDNFSAAVKYDPKHAEQLLEDAGWTKGADGIREKDGKKLVVRYPLLGDSPALAALARATQAMLKAVGVDMQIENRPTSEFSKIYTERDFDLFGLGFRSTDPFGPAYFGQTYSSDSGLNLSGTGTKEFDAKIAELQKLPTAEEQIKRANELETEAFKLFGVMPTFGGPSIVVTKKGLANYGAMGMVTVPKQMIGWKK